MTKTSELSSPKMRPELSAILKRIQLSGDIELNPGPFPTQFWKKDEEVENLQKIIDDQEDEIVDLKDVVDKQKDDIESLKEKLDELLIKANEISESSKQNSENVFRLEEKVEKEKKSTQGVFEELADHDGKLDKELIHQKETMNEALTSIVRDLNKFRGVLSQSKDQSDTYQREVNSRLTNIKRTVEDLKEKTWKLDNNTRSNLVFYGIKEDGSCCNAEFAVKEVRRRRPDTRLNLQYDKLYVNNVAYWFNEDTEEIELVNQSDGDIESQTVMKAAVGTRLKKRDGTPSKRRKNFLSKSYSSDSVANMSGSPVKEGVFTMDPMLEHALDFDTDDEDEHGDRD